MKHICDKHLGGKSFCWCLGGPQMTRSSRRVLPTVWQPSLILWCGFLDCQANRKKPFSLWTACELPGNETIIKRGNSEPFAVTGNHLANEGLGWPSDWEPLRLARQLVSEEDGVGHVCRPTVGWAEYWLHLCFIGLLFHPKFVVWH